MSDSAENGAPIGCFLSASGWPVIPCPDYCADTTAHHHHDEQGTVWTNPGEACEHLPQGAFYQDHARDMRDPEYRKAFIQESVIPPGMSNVDTQRVETGA